MNKKQLTVIIFFVLLTGAGMFFAGIKFAEKRQSSSQINENQLANNTEQAQAPAEKSESIIGIVTDKDSESFTIKLKDESDKKIMFSKNMIVKRNTPDEISNLQLGQEVSVNGRENSDGSIGAFSVVFRDKISNK